MSDRAIEYINEVLDNLRLYHEEALESLRTKCESPIEEMLIAALYCAAQHDPNDVHFLLGEPSLTDGPAFSPAVFVYPQAKIGKYRADFLILDASLVGKSRWMAVECDGHSFHEKTKEQARRDKQRDRYFQSQGIKVLRYTGSEIWADPDEIAAEILCELLCDDDWRAAHP